MTLARFLSIVILASSAAAAGTAPVPAPSPQKAAAAKKAPKAAEPQLAPKYRAWLQDEVAYIITDREREVFRDLPSDRERDLFIEEFWRQRDPTPNTPRNEFKDEHYRRLEYADRTFGRGAPGPGRKTDRGRMYVILGNPMDVERVVNPQIHGAEMWTYNGNPNLGQPATFRLLFYQWGGSPDYRLYNPTVDTPKRVTVNPEQETNMTFQNYLSARNAARSGTPYEPIWQTEGFGWPPAWDNIDRQAWRIIHELVSAEVAQAMMSIIPGTADPSRLLTMGVTLGRVEQSRKVAVADAYLDDFVAHKPTVEVNYSAFHIGNRFLGTALRDADGLFLLHYALVPEKISLESYGENTYAELRADVRLVDARGRTAFQRESDLPINLTREEVKRLEGRRFQFTDAFPVAPGRYTLHVLWENTVTREFTSVQSEIAIPDANALLLGPVLFNRNVITGAGEEGARRAFRVGTYQLNPVLDRTFGPADRVYVFFQVLGAAPALLERGRIDFRVTRDGAAVAEWTRPLAEVKGGVDVYETVPLEAPEPGRYLLSIQVKDADGATAMSRNEEFAFAGKAPEGTWVSGPSVPGAGDPKLAFDVGSQLLVVGRDADGLAALERAHRAKPDDSRFAAGYGRALLTAGRPADALAAVRPLTAAAQPSVDLLTVWADAAMAAKEYREAVDAYQKALTARGRVVDLLNSLGECYRSLGDKGSAAQSWRESLSIKPDQPSIAEALKTVQQ